MAVPPRIRPPLFLGRASYRQRRLRDALRILPVAGLVLLVLPLLWPTGPEGPGTARVLIYVFTVWFGLVAVCFVLARRMRPDDLIEAPAEDAP